LDQPTTTTTPNNNNNNNNTMSPMNSYLPGTAPFDATRRLNTGAPLPSTNLRAPYRTETKSPETSKRLDDVMLQYQQQQKMLQHKPSYFPPPPPPLNTQSIPPPTSSSPIYQDPFGSSTLANNYNSQAGGRMLPSQPIIGGKYERKRVLADETNPIEPSIADPLFSVKRTHFHPPTGSSSSRV
jgi:casein kinase I family protein HRR25